MADLVDGLKVLGLTTATAVEVDEVMKALYPGGCDGIYEGEVLKAVFLEIRRRGSEEGG